MINTDTIIRKIRDEFFLLICLGSGAENAVDIWLININEQYPDMADVIINGNENYTSLVHETIARSKLPDVLELLLAFPATDVNKKDIRGYSPLEAAYILYYGKIFVEFIKIPEPIRRRVPNCRNLEINHIINLPGTYTESTLKYNTRIPLYFSVLLALIKCDRVNINEKFKFTDPYNHSGMVYVNNIFSEYLSDENILQRLNRLYNILLQLPPTTIVEDDNHGNMCVQHDNTTHIYSYFYCNTILEHAVLSSNMQLVQLILTRGDVIIN